MLKPNSFNLRRKIFLLAVLIGCLALVSPTKIERRVLADNNFFPQMDYCDVIYWGQYYHCRNNDPYLPCPIQEYGVYTECLGYRDGPPLEQPDFCANARLARDTCNLRYGSASGNSPYTDDIFYACVDASGISYCE
jgi:hypothetical protein